MIKAQTLKGFRDFLPQEAKKRQYVIDTLKSVFESYGFEPLETPALEYEEILLGKYGEEGDKLMYRFEDRGKRKVALRYDQTVPLARVVAQYGDKLPMPFKRYQIQNVWRADNTQKGRYREFLQCDTDIVGTDSPLADAEIIALAIKSLENLGFVNFKILVNDRENLNFANKSIKLSQDQNIKAMIAVDKLKKIGKEAVIKELEKSGFSNEESLLILKTVKESMPTKKLNEIFIKLEDLSISSSKYEFSPTLARGLNYYTGLIIEIEVPQYSAGSLGGGGRYYNLIGLFANKQIPAVGFAFGFDRIVEALEEFKLFPFELNNTKVLVTVFSQELAEESMKIAGELRSQNINTELWLDTETKLGKQL